MSSTVSDSRSKSRRSSTIAADAPKRAHVLDGLRGVAACAVVIFHAILNNDLSLIDRVLVAPWQDSTGLRDALTKLALVIFNGKAAVVLFFVLSGCVLRLSLEKHSREFAGSLSLRFVAARLLRLYPPVIACMILFYSVSLIGIPGYPSFTPMNLLNNALLWKIQMHGPSLTVQAELLSVPFILAVYFLRRHFGIVGLGIVFVYGLMAAEIPWMTLRLPALSLYLPPLLVGLVLPEPALRPLFSQASPNAWWAALACALLSQAFVWHGLISGVIASNIAAALLVAGLLYGRHGSLHRFLEHPVCLLLGRISFSFYLLNLPILDLLWAFTNRMSWPKQHALESGILTGALAIILTLPLAWASERLIERPSIAAGRWIWSVLRPQSPSDVSEDSAPYRPSILDPATLSLSASPGSRS